MDKTQAQADVAERSLLQQYAQAATDSEKVYRLYPLINFYYAFNNERTADSLRDLQLVAAEESRSRSLMLGSLFPVYDNSITANSSTQRFAKELGFANQALEYAKSVNMNNYVALAYARIAGVHRNSGQPDLALTNADIAFTTAIGSGDDSVKIVTALELGNVFMQKKNMLMAFRKFSNALDFANNLRNPFLLSSVYYNFSLLYKQLGSTAQAKEYVMKSIEYDTKADNTKGLVKDYVTLSKIVDFIPAKTYLQKALSLAESLNDPVLKLSVNQTLFNQYMIYESSEASLNFLKSHPDVERALNGIGEYYYEWIVGEVFLYKEKYDSAFTHFKKAEPSYDANHNISGKINFLSELAACCAGLKLYKEAIAYYTATLQLATSSMNLLERHDALGALQELYYQTGDFQKAYQYARDYNSLHDSVTVLNGQKEIVLGEIDNENKRIQKENELAVKALQRRHDAQYMLITIAVAVVFLLLVLLGLFTVSTTTIRVLGFFSFIFLFELITLLLDNWIHDKTHGEPWKIWLIKIMIISMIYPLHHWLEHKLIHYLLNKKLIRVGTIFSFKKMMNWFKKPTAPVVQTEAVDQPEGSDTVT